jgi:uncharacterized membrane protein YdjX (TVP38/TMEM64 family)
MKKKAAIVFWLVVTIIPIIGILLSITDPQTFDSAQSIWRERIVIFGVLAPIVFILIQALQVIVTPISHYSVGVLGGFLFGPWLGALYNWIGRMIGHVAAFLIARSLGRRIATKFVSKETIDKYDKHVSNKLFTLFIFYWLPLFPDDELSYLAGLSRMDFKKFILVSVFGHIGGSFALAYAGAGIDTSDPIFWGIIIVSLLLFIPLWFTWRKTRRN